MSEKIVFCRGGGCTAKLGAGILSHVLSKLPKAPYDENLLVGYDSKDDAAVYKISEDVALVQTLDFFPPMVEDPYTFGKIAATNALSDIYAMGGEVKTALNIVCFPEDMDLNILGEIMRGGAEKVIEAGGQLAGGHSIADSDVKYGLSVTGVVNPQKIYQNNTGKVGDKLILTKKLKREIENIAKTHPNPPNKISLNIKHKINIKKLTIYINIIHILVYKADLNVIFNIFCVGLEFLHLYYRTDRQSASTKDR